uniref:Metalloendopeptidase n=1 Tax=Parastrongyloides trichosuri TaxID=131310 RepID=A0A0N4ZEC6_PARTI
VIGIQELIHNSLLVKNEHTRSDRDEYIKVIATLADPKDMYRFNIDNASDTTFFGMAYDYGSMTHFSSTQYADTGKEIITATKYHEHYKRTMGQRVMVTFNDYKLLNYYYCNNTCTSRKTNCQNDGYQDPNNCDKCKCPSGYVGNECQNIAPSENECGSWTYDAQPYKQNLRVCGRINCYIRIISQ